MHLVKNLKTHPADFTNCKSVCRKFDSYLLFNQDLLIRIGNSSSVGRAPELNTCLVIKGAYSDLKIMTQEITGSSPVIIS